MADQVIATNAGGAVKLVLEIDKRLGLVTAIRVDATVPARLVMLMKVGQDLDVAISPPGWRLDLPVSDRFAHDLGPEPLPDNRPWSAFRLSCSTSAMAAAKIIPAKGP